MRTWDLRTHRQIGEPITGDSERLWAATLGVVAERQVAVTSYGPSLDLWDLATREHLGEVVAPYLWRTPTAICAVACTVWNGGPIGVLRGHQDDVWSVAFGALDDRPIALSGSRDKPMRVWDRCSRAADVPLLHAVPGASVTVFYSCVTPVKHR